MTSKNFPKTISVTEVVHDRLKELRKVDREPLGDVVERYLPKPLTGEI